MAKETKEDLVKALVKAGYAKKDVKDLSLKELQDLVAKDAAEDEDAEDAEESEDSDEASDEEESEEDESEDDESEEDDEEVEAKGDEVDIIKVSGDTTEYVRTFSKKVHGKDFKQIAKDFCDKHIKCSISKTPVTDLVVKWREFDKKANAGQGAQVEKAERFKKKQDALLFSQKDGKVRKVVLVAKPKA